MSATGDSVEPPLIDGRTVFAAALDDKRLAELAPGQPSDTSVGLTVTGQPPTPWRTIRAADAAGELGP